MRTVRMSAVWLSLLLAAVLMSALPAPAAGLPPAEGWTRSGEPGLGDADNYMVSALAVQGGHLYAGTYNDSGAQVWRRDGAVWAQVSPGFDLVTTLIYAAEVFGDDLYIGTATAGGGGEIWRSAGASWERVLTQGTGSDAHTGFSALATLDGVLYALATDAGAIHVWGSTSGDADTWTEVATPAELPLASQHVVLEPFDGHLYLGLFPTDNHAQLWRFDGEEWEAVFQDGLGNPNNTAVSAMAEFEGVLYVGFRNLADGAEVWRSTSGDPGEGNWSEVASGEDWGDANNRPYSLIVRGATLFLALNRSAGSAEVWITEDGEAWLPTKSPGLSCPDNALIDYFDQAAAVFQGDLFIGTWNTAAGGEVWHYGPVTRSYLPVLLRQ